MSEDPKPELETETAPETAPEPIAEPATAVVTRAEIILDRLAAQQQRILDDQAALADRCAPSSTASAFSATTSP